MSGKYSAGAKPNEGRIATTDDALEEAWSRRATERNWAILGAVERIARSHDATASQVALAWLLTRPAVSSVIIGARTIEQLEDNMGAVTVQLTNEDVAELNAVSELPEIYPYRMMSEYGME